MSAQDVVHSVAYPYVGLNEKTHGLRKSELTTITAGSGIGKSNLARDRLPPHRLRRTCRFYHARGDSKAYCSGTDGTTFKQPLHLGNTESTEEELRYDYVIGNGNTYFYDSFGSTAIDNLLSRIRFLAQGCECSYIVLDHLSIVVSGLGDGDERRLIDNAMTALRTLVQETGVGLILISHLKRPVVTRVTKKAHRLHCLS